MGRNVSAIHRIPENPDLKSFPRSDGNSSSWPTNTTPIVEAGHVNYMEHLDLDTAASIRWRVEVGKALGRALQWPEGPNYVLAGWPDGYRMFCHNKGPQANPRQDLYLFGSRATAKFRSVNEFIPHARWLFEDPTMNPSNCTCKYCSKKSQREVTADMGNEGIIEKPTYSYAPSNISSSVPPQRRATRPREPLMFSAVQVTLEPTKNVYLGATMKHEQVADLRALFQGTTRKFRRWCRVDEVVWCDMTTPIIGPGDTSIRLWPGIVEDVTVKQHVDPPKANGDSDPDTPWDVTQYTVYKVKLFATSCSWHVEDKMVLPYQAYLPPTSLLHALAPLVPKYGLDRGPSFNPCPEMISGASSSALPTVSFEEAAGPYTWAVQIASQITLSWGLTDSWDFEYTIRKRPSLPSTPQLPPPPPAVPLPKPSEGLSLSEVMNAANLANGETMNFPSSSVPPTRSGTPSHRKQANGTDSSNRGTQTRFQGLYWGPERIWVDDMVRLKPPRRGIAPKGTPYILAPARPSKSARQAYDPSQFPEEATGASSRGVFMKIDSFFMAEVQTMNEDGTRAKMKKECRVAGMLYELADIDWDESDQGDTPEVSNSIPSIPHASSFGAPNTDLLKNPEDSLPQVMSQPSPLKPSALPNPDPAVPVEATTSDILTQQGLPTTAVVRTRRSGGVSPNQTTPAISTQLSGPPKPDTFLPDAPVGYKFRPILREGYEGIFSLAMMCGRYYPRILDHPLLKEQLDEAAEAVQHDIPEDTGVVGVVKHTTLWALEGLVGGYMNAVDPRRYKSTRQKMVDIAKTEAVDELNEYQARAYPDGMEVDDDRAHESISQAGRGGIGTHEHPMEIDIDS